MILSYGMRFWEKKLKIILFQNFYDVHENA